ncbi:hypothetical protein BpHYR1_020671 [Brachionus plicatilis]|uniref:Uncharacterized protein n=1 Tax=Brachionus plicatilis TaxID=10195 RepID=A0A3M7T770_BRAPC|nr:hypothetical protein BpHYR1_020671 [Brachionus plicatilis]
MVDFKNLCTFAKTGQTDSSSNSYQIAILWKKLYTCYVRPNLNAKAHPERHKIARKSSKQSHESHT